MIRRLLIAAMLISVPATAARRSDEARLAKLLQGRVARKPVTCLPLSRYQDTRTFGSAVAYQVGGTWYVNRFSGRCPQLKDGRALISRHQSQICRGDIGEVVLPQAAGMSYGSCVFGDFTPYARPR
jgi:hypothetical protein